MSTVKHNNITPKEHQQNNELNFKNDSKFSPKTLKLHHWYSLTVLITNFDQCSFPKLFLLTVKNIKFEEIPIAITILKIIITTTTKMVIIITIIIVITIAVIIINIIINNNYNYNQYL